MVFVSIVSISQVGARNGGAQSIPVLLLKMFPVLLRFGPLTIHTYGFLVAIGFLVGLWVAALQAQREGIPRAKIMDLGFYILLAAIVGSRLFFVLLNIEQYINRPLDVFKIWQGGLVFYGGVLFAVPITVWYTRKHGLHLWKIADIFAPSLALGHAFGRLGCFAAGCCHGKPAHDLPWGVIFTNPESLAPTNIPLHPTQLYESAGEMLIFIILVWVRRHQIFQGELFALYMCLYAGLRFVVEFFRGDPGRGFITEGLSVSQGISVLLFAVGVIGFIVLRKKTLRADQRGR